MYAECAREDSVARSVVALVVGRVARNETRRSSLHFSYLKNSTKICIIELCHLYEKSQYFLLTKHADAAYKVH